MSTHSSIDVKKSAEQIQIGSVKVNPISKSGGITEAQMLRLVVRIMQQLNFPMLFSVHGKKYSAESFIKVVERRGRWGLTTEAGGLSFRTGTVTSCRHAFIIIEEKVAGSAISWANWVEPFLAEQGFAQAWVSDVDYDHWQNAEDTLEYTVVGRDYSQLPMKSNGLPPPVERMIIDISNNPGRWSLKSGYIEAIGAIMWLGEPFWNLVGADRKERIKQTKWLNHEVMDHNILRLQASESCFSDEHTEGLQNDLRALLYS